MRTDAELSEDLPAYDVAPAQAEHIRRRAHAILQGHRRHLAQPRRARLSNCYHQIIEPVVLIGMGLCFLLWTVHDTVAMFR
jgi:hypothetical protein